MKTLLRDPLLHFLLLGIGLFVLYRLVAGEDVGPKEIVVSARTVEGLADNWRRTWQRPPTQDELDSLVETMCAKRCCIAKPWPRDSIAMTRSCAAG